MLITVAALITCAPAVEEESASGPAAVGEADPRAVRDLLAEYTRAVNNKDLEGILACFSDEGVMMPPNAPALAGKEALRARYAAFTSGPAVFDVTFTPTEVEVAGDWAFARGDFSGTVADAEGEQARVSSKAIFITRRQGSGSWRIARYIYNSDLPPAAE